MKSNKKNGSWLTTMPNKLNGTELSAEQFRDSLRPQFGLKPQNMPTHCDGCHQRFTVGHALQCRKGGLITQRHNDMVATVGALCRTAFTKSSVRDEPSIPNYQTLGQVNGNNGEQNQPQALRGDLSVNSFWRTGTQAIFDIRVTDTEAASHRNKDPAKVLRQQEEEKKRKYLIPCQQAHKHFTPLVYSVDGLEGKEAAAMRKQLASRLSAKYSRRP
mmetsp:Transcript_13622/g.28127  ORF Transcript_13622/g.28127 Transcript_13622/m.28127 type:complete len:216 (+) Transcript_13622:278-925(+)